MNGLLWVTLSFFAVLLALAIGTRIVARSWYEEKRRHLRRMLTSDPSELEIEEETILKENKRDELER